MQILLGLDGSQESMEAAHYLANLPFAEKPQVTAVTIFTDSQFDLATSQAGLKLRELEKTAAAEAFEKAQLILGPAGIEAEHIVVGGHPRRELLKLAESKRADLIVLGSHGHSAVSRAVLGSTSDYIANHAKCSVLIVRPTLEHGENEKITFKLALAYDGSDSSNTAAQRLFELDWSAETSIDIAMMLGRPHLIPEDEVYDQDAIEGGDKSITELIANSKCAGKVTHIVKEVMHVGGAITSLTREKDTDIIFIGDAGRSSISRLFLGSVSRYVSHHVDCSVWIARDNKW